MGLLSGILARLAPAPAAGAQRGAVAQQSIGMYSGYGALPQDPRTALTREILPGMSGPPGIRLSGSTDRAARYFGTDAVPPVRYPLTGPKTVNRPIDLEVAALKDN